MTASLFAAAIGTLLATAIQPVKDALVAGVENPGGVAGNLGTLVDKSALNLPSLEHAAITEGCKLSLAGLASIEAEIAKLIGLAPAADTAAKAATETAGTSESSPPAA